MMIVVCPLNTLLGYQTFLNQLEKQAEKMPLSALSDQKKGRPQ